MDASFLVASIGIAGCIFFGTITVFLSFKEDKLKKALLHMQEEKKLALHNPPTETTTPDPLIICKPILDMLAEGICILSATKEVLVINQAMYAYLGFKPGPLQFQDFSYVVSEWYPLSEKLQTLLQSNQDISDSNVVFGSHVYTLHLSIIALPENKKGILFTISDETGERNTEENRETLTNMMVHELRSPLTAIKSSAELIESSGEKLSDEQRKNLVTLIAEQSRKLLDEVGSILDAAKFKNGKLTMNKTQNNFVKILNDRINLFSSQANAKHVTLETHIDSTIPQFTFDAVRMGQVVNNLLSNSLKFTPAGGTITLTAKVSDDKKSVILQVQDTGAGIPEEKQKDLFTKYAQSSTSISTGQKQVGTGLGLYVVKGIIDAHNGTITVESKVNQGTTITATIPFEQNSPQQTP